MGSSREASHGLLPKEEFQDETGLELSLGLGLSSSDSRQTWKASKGTSARFLPLVDLAGDRSAVATLNGLHPLTKLKPLNKASGLDAALEKFLLDDQEESVKLLDGSNSFSLQKEKDKHSPTGSNENPSQHLDTVAYDVENKGNPFLFKELQGSKGLSTTRSQSPAHTTPLQFVDAFKSTSNSGSLHWVEGAGHFDQDDTIQENLGQQKFHDMKRKRKHVVEEQKHQKKGKEEEKLLGCCQTGSNTWMDASAVDMEKWPLGFKGDDVNERIKPVTSEEKQDSAEAEMRLQGKGCESDGDESTGCERNTNAALGQNDTKVPNDEFKGGEVKFTPQLKAIETVQKTAIRAEDESTWHFSLMNSNTMTMKLQDREKWKGLSTSPKDGPDFTVRREVDKAGSPLQRTREKVHSETSSVSTGGTDKLEDKSRGGEASSSVPEVLASHKASAPASTLATSFCAPAPTTSSAPVPYPASPYPVVPIPYSLPASMPNSHGMSFPVGMNFPYMMQYVPPRSETSEQNVRPVGNNAFQPAKIEYPPQLSPSEGASWMQAFRPPVLSPFPNPSSGALYCRNAMAVMPEDGNIRLPVGRIHDNGVGKASPAAGISSLQNHPLFRTAVHSGAHDQVPEVPVLSSLPIPAVPHFTSQLGMSDHGELRSTKEQNGMNAFPGFAASVQVEQAHALPGLGRLSSSSGAKEDARQEQAKFGGRRSSSPGMQQQHVHNRNIMEPCQEEFGRVVGSHFHQGSTENLSVLDGLGEDMAFLQNGMAPGLKFGGTGTTPDLPWVHTTGSNGQTIGGVLYRLSRTQLRIVCACHGKHMSPVEFAQHASGVDVGNTDKNDVVSSPLTTHAA